MKFLSSGQIFEKKIFWYQISWKSIQWEPSCSMRTDVTDRQIFITKLILAFPQSVPPPQKKRKRVSYLHQHSLREPHIFSKSELHNNEDFWAKHVAVNYEWCLVWSVEGEKLECVGRWLGGWVMRNVSVRITAVTVGDDTQRKYRRCRRLHNPLCLP